MIKNRTLHDLVKLWRAICHKHAPYRIGMTKRHPRLDIIRYTKAFSKAKTEAFRYPKFSNIDYPPEVLREVYNASARVCNSLADAKEFGNADAMKRRTREILGDLNNVIYPLGGR